MEQPSLQQIQDNNDVEHTLQNIASPQKIIIIDYNIVRISPANDPKINNEDQNNHSTQFNYQQRRKIQIGDKGPLLVSIVQPSNRQTVKQNPVSIEQIIFQKSNNKSEVMDIPMAYLPNYNLQKIRNKQQINENKQSQHQQNNQQIHEEEVQDQNNFNQQIVFFLLVGWIIQFVLAKKDPSVCLDSGPSNLLTFRIWLWVDGSFTLLLSFFFTIFYYIKQVGCKNVFCLQIILKVPCFIFKVIWILIGLGIYLNNLNFDDCSSSVINFMSFFFITFFYVFSLLMVRMIGEIYKMYKKDMKATQIMHKVLVQFTSIQKSIKPQNESLRNIFQKQYKIFQRIQKKKQNLAQQQLVQIIDELKFSYKKIDKLPNIVWPGIVTILKKSTNKTKIQKQNKSQVIFFLIIGWCIEFVLAQKDHSQCLETLLFTISFTFREWLWIDGGGTLAYSITYALKKFMKNTEQYKCLRQLFVVLNYASFIFKSIWICFGIVAFLWDLNFINCSDILIQFMCLYFLTFLYIISFYILYRLPERFQIVDKIGDCLKNSQTFRGCFIDNNTTDYP